MFSFDHPSDQMAAFAATFGGSYLDYYHGSSDFHVSLGKPDTPCDGRPVQPVSGPERLFLCPRRRSGIIVTNALRLDPENRSDLINVSKLMATWTLCRHPDMLPCIGSLGTDFCAE